jgi:hypothetical protein
MQDGFHWKRLVAPICFPRIDLDAARSRSAVCTLEPRGRKRGRHGASHVPGTVGRLRASQSAQADFVSLLRRIHSLCLDLPSLYHVGMHVYIEVDRRTYFDPSTDDHPRREHPPIYPPPDPLRGVGGVRARLIR